MKVIKRSGLLIPREYQYENFYIAIREHLERRMQSFNSTATVVYRFYSESERFLLIPRCFPIHEYMFDIQIEDHRHEGEDIDIEHIIKARTTSQTNAMTHLMANENAMLQLSPGVGKTVISIYMISERKKKAIILVHRESLAIQWKNRFQEFTNMGEDDIAILKSSTFEDDLDHPIIITTVQTFLSLLKRNRQNFLVKLNSANIGICVGDEVHTTVGAPSFSECSIHIPSKYVYGLSATPERQDGNGDIIEYHLGDIYADVDDEGTMKAKAIVVLIDYDIDNAYRKKYLYWGGDFQRARYLNLIKKSKPFLAAIKGLFYKLKEKNIICIAERIKLIDDLHTMMPQKSKAKFCGSGGLETLDSKCTFATPGKCRDGIDAPWKDTLIMTSPITNIEQLAGRVTRLKEDKEMPLIVDMVDYGCDKMSGSFFARQEYYDKKGWNVEYVLLKDGKVIKVDKPETYQIINGG